MKSTAYPSQVLDTRAGQGLFAAEDLDKDTAVEKLEGRVVRYDQIPEREIRYAFEIGNDRWIVPTNAARFINHSCEPNCYLSESLEVLTVRNVGKGEELTIMYNEVTIEAYMNAGAVLPKWDQRRNFDCLCGSKKCLGRIDRYIVPVPDDPNSANVRIGLVPIRGRAMFATKKIRKGELIERAPVIVIPKEQWPDGEKTVMSDYAFDWGKHDEHAAIALGYISIYNHSYTPNAYLEQQLDELMMEIIALEDIAPGEEITINYNGDPKKRDPLWFTD